MQPRPRDLPPPPSAGSLRRPACLRPGDQVRVVAPSGPVDERLLDRGVAALRELGLVVGLAPHVTHRAGFLAGADADRAADLQDAWCDEGVAAVVCARGGYGAARLLPLLDWAALDRARPKVLLGSSDVTALHDAFGALLGVSTVFGPMPAGVPLGGDPRDLATIEGLRRTLLDPHGATTLATGLRTVTPGRATGRVVGGTLTLLAASCGTAYGRPARDAIVVLEDVGEPAYRLDRCITQLVQAGWFDGVRGVVLGSWEACGPDAEATVVAALRPLGVPLARGLGFGHGRSQLCVPLGVAAELDATAGRLTYVEPPLSDRPST
jgi:muramoyltetrapeptide carboxypeptidase